MSDAVASLDFSDFKIKLEFAIGSKAIPIPMVEFKF
jgi:hypothetical protein